LKGVAIMATVNYTLRINEADKQNAEQVFKDLGMTFATGINIYLKTVGRQRKIPFILETDSDVYKKEAKKRFKENMQAMQEQSVINGTDNITMDEIDDIIAEVLEEKRREINV